MSMPNRISRINTTIDNHIFAWSSIPSFAPMAEILRNSRDILVEKLLDLTERGVPEGANARDAVRLFLINFALERMAGEITSEHFTIFRDTETVEVILEDSYGIQCRADRDDILIPHQNEALKILIQCLFHRVKAADEKDILCFLHMFSRATPPARQDQDRTMRLRSMIWFIYLAIEIVKTERAVCSKGLEYFRNKFRELLDRTIEGTIIDEESRRPGFEDGRWEKTLFGWLQGEDRREFAIKLRRQFNMENRLEHVNRCLLADHRRCILVQVMAMFCNRPDGRAK
ncbi:MAG: hypothetical protein P4L55_14370 [Syntrophobacteraceae bacterium]|nr:hypothetical protein [Syntrophobacteraceae bacterium]